VRSWSLYKNSPRGSFRFTSRDAPLKPWSPQSAAEVGTLAAN